MLVLSSVCNIWPGHEDLHMQAPRFNSSLEKVEKKLTVHKSHISGKVVSFCLSTNCSNNLAARPMAALMLPKYGCTGTPHPSVVQTRVDLYYRCGYIQ